MGACPPFKPGAGSKSGLDYLRAERYLHLGAGHHARCPSLHFAYRQNTRDERIGQSTCLVPAGATRMGVFGRSFTPRESLYGCPPLNRALTI